MPDAPGTDRKSASWVTPGTAPERRSRRSALWRPDTFLAVGFMLALDLALVVLTMAGIGLHNLRGVTTHSCLSSHGAAVTADDVGFWMLGALLAVGAGLAVWRRAHAVAIVVTQIVVVAVLLPNLISSRIALDDTAHRHDHSCFEAPF